MLILSTFTIGLAYYQKILNIEIPDDETSWSGVRWYVGQTKHNTTLLSTEKGDFFGNDYAAFDFGEVKEESATMLPDGKRIIISVVFPKRGYIIYTVKEW